MSVISIRPGHYIEAPDIYMYMWCKGDGEEGRGGKDGDEGRKRDVRGRLR